MQQPAGEHLAEFAGRAGRPATAVRLTGAAAAVREAIEAVPHPAAQQQLDSMASSLRRELGGNAYVDVWKAGWALPLDEAVVEALALADALADGTPTSGG